MTQEYRKREIPYPGKGNDDAVRMYCDAIEKEERDIVKCADKVLATYNAFREQVKKELIA